VTGKIVMMVEVPISVIDECFILKKTNPPRGVFAWFVALQFGKAEL